MQKACFIYNPRAGSAGDMTHVADREFARRGLRIFPVTRPGGASDAARKAMQDGYDRLIVGGGDGTISQVVNGVAPDFERVELGLVPLGTGNDLARTLGVPLDDVAVAVDLAVNGQATPIDLMHVAGTSPEYCVNAATGGVGAKVAADVESHDKLRWGPFAYWLTAVTKLVELREFHVRIELDDESHEMPLYGLVVANGRFVGGGFPIAPAASINDGYLDITAIPVLPTLELLAAGLNFTFGRHYADRVQSFRSRRVHVVTQPEMQFSVDGEPSKTIDTTFEVLPGVLRVVRL